MAKYSLQGIFICFLQNLRRALLVYLPSSGIHTSSSNTLKGKCLAFVPRAYVYFASKVFLSFLGFKIYPLTGLFAQRLQRVFLQYISYSENNIDQVRLPILLVVS